MKLESVLVKNNLNGEETVLPLDGLFVAIGKEPQNEIFAEVTELDENGYVKADETCATSVPGVRCRGHPHEAAAPGSDGGQRRRRRG